MFAAMLLRPALCYSFMVFGEMPDPCYVNRQESYEKRHCVSLMHFPFSVTLPSITYYEALCSYAILFFFISLFTYVYNDLRMDPTIKEFTATAT